MKTKKLVSLLLATAILFSVLAAAIPVSAASMTTSEDAITILKKLEGFLKYPTWDYAQYSVGYGSRCPTEDYERLAKDGIKEKEADALLRSYVADTEADINKFASRFGLNLSQNQFDALILFSYNCGTAWSKKNSGDFLNAVVKGKTGNDFLYAIALWSSAGGEILPGLITRRLAEANLYLNGVYNMTRPTNYCYVIFNANGGSCSEDVYAYDAKTPITVMPTATRANATFLGWYTGSKTGMKITSLGKSSDTRTLFAHWQEEIPEEPEVDPEYPGAVPVNVIRQISVSDTLNVREEPTTSAFILRALHNNDVVHIVKEYYDENGILWGKLSDEGWISLQYTKEYTEPEQPEEPPQEPGTEEPHVTFTEESLETPVTVTVTGNVVNLREMPSTDFPVRRTVAGGSTLTVTKTATIDGTDWGWTGSYWICLDYTDFGKQMGEPGSEEPEVKAVRATVNVDNLRIRSGAGTSYAEVGRLALGTEIGIVEEKTVSGILWGKLVDGRGWVCMGYGYVVKLPEEEPESPLPDTTNATVMTDNLRVRRSPGSSAVQVDTKMKDERITILEEKTLDGVLWGRIDSGWLCMSYGYVQKDPEIPPMERFIKRLYSVCLGREAEENEIAFYKWEMTDQGMTGVEAAYKFVFSDEFKIKNYCDRHYAIRLYEAFMGREPSEDEIAHWAWRIQGGDTREDVFNYFAMSAEFGEICKAAGITQGTALNLEGQSTKAGGYCSVKGCDHTQGVVSFARQLYTACLGRDPEPEEVDAWHYNLVHGDYTATTAAHGFLFSAEFLAQQYSDAVFVERVYQAMMGRSPSQEETAFWCWMLADQGLSREDVFGSFARQDEFKLLCQNYGVICV